MKYSVGQRVQITSELWKDRYGTIFSAPGEAFKDSAYRIQLDKDGGEYGGYIFSFFPGSFVSCGDYGRRVTIKSGAWAGKSGFILKEIPENGAFRIQIDGGFCSSWFRDEFEFD